MGRSRAARGKLAERIPSYLDANGRRVRPQGTSMHRDASSESVAPWVNVPPAHRPSTDGSSTSGTDIAPNAGGYRPAIKLVKTKEDMHKFHKSAAHADLTGFVIALNAAVVGKRITEECTVSPAAEAMVDVLKTMEVNSPSRRLSRMMRAPNTQHGVSML